MPAPLLCAIHRIADCPVCRRHQLEAAAAESRRTHPEIFGYPDEGKGAEGGTVASPERTPHARVRDEPYFVTPFDSDFGTGVAMRMAGGNHRICIVPRHGLHRPERIADALNMMHHVRAGTAGNVAALEEFELPDGLKTSDAREAVAQWQIHYRDMAKLAGERREAMAKAAGERDRAQECEFALRGMLADVRREVTEAKRWPRTTDAAIRFAVVSGRHDQMGLCRAAVQAVEGEGSPGERTKVEILSRLDALSRAIGLPDPEREESAVPSYQSQEQDQDVEKDGFITVLGVTSQDQAARLARHSIERTFGLRRHDVGYPHEDHCPASDEFPHPVDALREVAKRAGFTVDEERMAELRAVCDEPVAEETASDRLASHMGADPADVSLVDDLRLVGLGSFTAGKLYEDTDAGAGADSIEAAVFDGEGQPFCTVSIDVVIGGSVEAAVARCQMIAGKLNEASLAAYRRAQFQGWHKP